MDSGRLSFELCEAKIEEHRTQDQVNEPCCACEEAKYEVTFEGLWSEKSHPKDFPTSRWLLHFSDIIGASHSAGYRCVPYNSYILHTGCNISWRLPSEAINCVVSFFPPKKCSKRICLMIYCSIQSVGIWRTCFKGFGPGGQMGFSACLGKWTEGRKPSHTHYY